MKKSSPAAASPPSVVWRVIAIVSISGNILLAAWAWRAAARPVGASAPSPEKSASTTASLTTARNPLGASSPYAALGSYLAENNRIADLNWTAPQFAAFLDGIRASYEGRGLPLDEDAKRLRDDISQRVQAMLAREQPNPVEDYFRTLREKEGVSRTATGLHFRITEPGFGSSPDIKDTVVLSFAARLPDGHELPPLTRTRVKMGVQDLLPGLAEGVQLMHEGGKALVYLPPQLAFTDASWPPQIPRGAPLAFFVELHEIVPASK